MPKHKIIPKAKYPVQTQKFIQDVSDALEEFEENIQFPDEEIREGAYSVLLTAYHSALTSIWSSAQFADTEKILKTISERQMVELTIMSKKTATRTNHQQSIERTKDRSGPRTTYRNIKRFIRRVTKCQNLCPDSRHVQQTRGRT